MVSYSTLVVKALAVYAITFVVVSSSLFEPLRKSISEKTPRLRTYGNKHPIDCRMCFGFWAAVLVCNFDYRLILPVYGLSYFMATQER